MTSLLRRHGVLLLLLTILASAFFLRVYGQDWDQGTYQHPDERFIAMVSADRVTFPDRDNLGDLFDPANSPINPRRDDSNGNPLSFAYGSLPVYVQGTVSALLNTVSERDWNSFRELYRVGRTLTAILDTVTVLMVFLLGRRLFGNVAGLLASALYASTVLAIQLAHFFAVDTWLTLFVTIVLYLLIRYIDRPTIGRSLAVGAVIGLVFATKASVPSLLVPVVIAYGYVFLSARRKPDVLVGAALGAIVSLAVFTVFEPYALVRSAPFIEDIRIQSRIVRGITDIPFTRQFVGLTPGLYELRNLFLYTVGPGFIVAGIAGVIFAIRRVFAVRDVAVALPVLWILAYIPTLLITEARFLRYSLPLIPSMAVLAAGLLVWLLSRREYRRIGQVATALVLISTVVWGLGFMTIYTQEHTRITASRWIHEHVPPGTVISAESWDDPLPTRYPGSPPLQYDIRTLDIYGDLPPEEKVAYLYEALQDVEYIVLSSNRLIDSVDNLPWRYAVQNEYYRRLTNGQLGYQLVHEGLVRPEIFGIAYDDRQADESFTVYDHPHVRIFQRVEPLTFEEFRARLLWGIAQPWEPSRYQSQQRLLLDGPVAEFPTGGDTGWNGPAVRSGIVAVMSWLVAIELVGLAALPLAGRLFRRMPDRGAFSARLLGLLIVGWLVWIGGSLNLWPATLWTVVIAVLMLALVAWASVAIRGDPKRVLPTRSNFLAGAGIFWGLFALFLLFRTAYPDFWQTYYGGEKPFELAYLRAVSASLEFPPYDPWYADGFINYYYYGWHLVATLIKLSGVGVSHGFQLATATFAAFLGLQCVAVGGAIARRRRRLLPGGVAPAGLLAAFLVLIAGNLDGLRQLLEHGAATADRFDFWRSTRVIDYTINEFPYFSQIWADLHPHVINLPIYALLLTLLAALAIDARRPTGWPALTVIALTLGTVTVTNSWDAPLAIGLTMATFIYTGALRGGWHVVSGAGLGLLVTLTGFLLFAPFYTRFYSVVEGVEVASRNSEVGQFLTHWGLLFALVVTAALVPLVRIRRARGGINGALLAGSVALLAGGLAAVIQVVRGSAPELLVFPVTLVVIAGLISSAAAVNRVHQWPAALVAPVLGFAALSGVLAPIRPLAALAAGVTTVAVTFALRHVRQPSRFLPWALVAAACVTIAAVEILYVADDLRDSPWERMNTVFKFYLQAWLLLGIGAAVLVVGVLRRPDGRLRSSVPIAVLAFVVVAGLVYPFFGTPVRLAQDMPTTPRNLTLDGYAWMDGGWIHNGTGEQIDFTGDLDAIRWLDDHAGQTDVILEASIGPYRGNGSRISSATGNPTVLGWDRHQRQQRHEPGISMRMYDVRAIYNETDPRMKLEQLYRYGVRYVIVGDVERYWNTPEDTDYYASESGLAAFDTLVGNGLTKVFESAGTAIYEVDDFPRLVAASS